LCHKSHRYFIFISLFCAVVAEGALRSGKFTFESDEMETEVDTEEDESACEIANEEVSPFSF
jgi:hypothetical protein